MFYEVFIPRSGSLHAYAASVLGLVFCKRSPLDISEMRNRDDLVIIGIEVLRIELFCVRYDFRPSFIAIFGLELHGFVLDDFHLHCRICKNIVAPCDEFLQLVVLCLELFPFESGELTESHFHDGRSLCLRESECGHESISGLVHSLGSTDDPDDFVDDIDRLDEAFEDMCSLLRLVQVELGPADNDFVPEIHEHFQDVLERQCPRTTLDKCDIVDGEA